MHRGQGFGKGEGRMQTFENAEHGTLYAKTTNGAASTRCNSPFRCAAVRKQDGHVFACFAHDVQGISKPRSQALLLFFANPNSGAEALKIHKKWMLIL
jgi:hypothetical protein